MGDRARLNGLNLVGLQRRGFDKEAIRTLRAAYKVLFAADRTLAERVDQVGEEFGGQPVGQTTSCPSSARKRRVRSASPAWRMLPKLGIIAGGGDLPVRLLEACRSIGREAFVLGLEGACGARGIGRHVDLWVRLGAAGTMLDALRAAGAAISCWPAASAARQPRRTEAGLARRPSSSPASAARALGDDGLLKAWSRRNWKAKAFMWWRRRTCFRDLLTPAGSAGRPQARRAG